MNPQDNEQTELLREILKWTRFAGIKGVKEQLEMTLDTDPKRIVYQLSDGSKTIADVKKITGVSAGAISGYWKKWVMQGLGEKTSVKGGERFIRAFDLEDFGISVPEISLEKESGEKMKEGSIEESEASK